MPWADSAGSERRPGGRPGLDGRGARGIRVTGGKGKCEAGGLPQVPQSSRRQAGFSPGASWLKTRWLPSHGEATGDLGTSAPAPAAQGAPG